jgi:hypothetical protein
MSLLTKTKKSQQLNKQVTDTHLGRRVSDHLFANILAINRRIKWLVSFFALAKLVKSRFKLLTTNQAICILISKCLTRARWEVQITESVYRENSSWK